MPAVLEAWFPGTEAGHAIADVLVGDVNPGGKLPVTVPRTVGQVPIYYNHKSTGRPPTPDKKYTSKYIDMPWTPLYPFGYGLSYTTFAISDLRLSASTIRPDGPVRVSATVTNTGARSGDEVVQLYIQDVASTVTRPIRELKGFARVSLDPGARRQLKSVLTPAELGFYNRDMRFVVEPGVFKDWVGNSSSKGDSRVASPSSDSLPAPRLLLRQPSRGHGPGLSGDHLLTSPPALRNTPPHLDVSIPMRSILQDLRYGARILLRAPGFTTVAVLVLALGIGANTAVFTLVNALLFRPLNNGDTQPVVGLYSRDTARPDCYRGFSYPNYLDVRERSGLFTKLAALDFSMVGLSENRVTRRVFVALVSSNYFSALGVGAARGRAFSREEERPGRARPVAIVSYEERRRTGFDPGILERTLRLNGRPFAIVGVTPEGFNGTTAIVTPEISLPLGVHDDVMSAAFSEGPPRRLDDRATTALMVIGRLRRTSRRRTRRRGWPRSRPSSRRHTRRKTAIRLHAALPFAAQPGHAPAGRLGLKPSPRHCCSPCRASCWS